MLTEAIIGHLVGDYLLQNDWMALNKKKLGFDGDLACVAHCSIWTICVVMFAMLPTWTVIPLFLSHYAQDRTQVVAWWMDLIGQKQFRTGGCAPWSIIVVDNVWHIVAIWALCWFL